MRAAPGRPKQANAPSGLESAAPKLLEQLGTDDRGEASREPRPARPRAVREATSVGATSIPLSYNRAPHRTRYA